MTDIQRVTSVAGVMAADALFDGPVRADWAEKFVREPGHHLLVARVEGTPAGMVTGVEMTHPDQGTEMFLYELGVEEEYRGRGIGRGLVLALAELARTRGCHGMWVAADTDNEAARATYRSAGGSDDGPTTVFTWELE
ncbi:GNAT family N-acetyltransferase [Streptomyces sp. ACA25]|uniref:GNAT family N-acetyltransferase n=1 Tax=Streptomyces sp. ACA25 TaxID=3022596 RepID=UPI00230740C6|nr:GNAT family N-acetyltransferase [Streptomyces sp. ACA25]MDB1086675.1 GNAT family N-acetyltransferase [Streptomyces sp. ACA25]